MKNTIASPYAIDRRIADHEILREEKVFFDGVFKGDYSLAIVNRYLARSLIQKGVSLTLASAEEGWLQDPMLNDMQDVRSRFVSRYPLPKTYDIHLRNTWPPRADDMVGSYLNAYVCFAWEEMQVPRYIIDHFNMYLDLIMVTSNFVEQSLRKSGLSIPIVVVGNGTDHVLDFLPEVGGSNDRPSSRRVLHVSSCFPRKGADVLVKTFTDTFTKDDNIELIIKTFDNIHNTIRRTVDIVQEARPGAAPITVIDKSMSYLDLASLVQSSEVFVAPSRGEGFGLPLAEAILLGVPVVTTGYSGQCDFCTPETAWLVDYRLVPSEAHVSKEGAMWAEPDAASLGVQMTRALSERTAARAKLDRGQALLRAHFKWSDVARRVCQALGAINGVQNNANTQSSSPPLRIDLVSTWDQICGIATYSQHLFDTAALAPSLTRIMAREFRGDEILNDNHNMTKANSAEVTRPWGYEAAGIRRLEASLSAGCSDIIWIQHHPAFFSEADMEAIATAVKSSNSRLKVITLHNVRETCLDKPVKWIRNFDVVIVHTQEDFNILGAHGIEAVTIPHGILDPKQIKRSPSEYFTIGSFGFLYPHKNFPLLVEALALARSVEPRIRLQILSCVRSDPVSRKERVRLQATIRALDLERAVDIDFRFLPDDDVIDRLGQCDVLCFPYAESSESATGAARVALTVDRPLLCSQSLVLRDIHPFALVMPRVDVRTLADAMLTLSASPTICSLRDVQRKAYVERHAYTAIAQRHLRLFSSRIRGKT